MEYQIAICDDDDIFLGTLEVSLKKYEQLKSLSLRIFTYRNGEDLLVDYQNYHFNLLILDMEMPGLNGIEVAQELRRFDKDIDILYSTVHENFTREAFQVDATSYLVKPLVDELLFAKLDRIFDKLSLQASFHDFKDKYLTLESKKEVIQLPYCEILYITKRRNLLTIHTINGDNLIYMNIKDIRNRLDSSVFVKINPGQIVNWTKVTCLHDNIINLEDIELPVSRQYRTKLNGYYRQEIIASLRRKNDQED